MEKVVDVYRRTTLYGYVFTDIVGRRDLLLD